MHACGILSIVYRIIAPQYKCKGHNDMSGLKIGGYGLCQSQLAERSVAIARIQLVAMLSQFRPDSYEELVL